VLSVDQLHYQVNICVV